MPTRTAIGVTRATRSTTVHTTTATLRPILMPALLFWDRPLLSRACRMDRIRAGMEKMRHPNKPHVMKVQTENTKAHFATQSDSLRLRTHEWCLLPWAAHLPITMMVLGFNFEESEQMAVLVSRIRSSAVLCNRGKGLVIRETTTIYPSQSCTPQHRPIFLLPTATQRLNRDCLQLMSDQR